MVGLSAVAGCSQRAATPASGNRNVIWQEPPVARNARPAGPTTVTAMEVGPGAAVVTRTWPVSAAPYQSGGVKAGPTYYHSADQVPPKMPDWQLPFYSLGYFVLDTIELPYHAVVQRPLSEVTYRGDAFNGTNAGPKPE